MRDLKEFHANESKHHKQSINWNALSPVSCSLFFCFLFLATLKQKGAWKHCPLRHINKKKVRIFIQKSWFIFLTNSHTGYMDLLARSNYGINNDITPLFGNLVNHFLSSNGTDFSLWIEKQLLPPDKPENSAPRLTTSALFLRQGIYRDFNASSTNSTTIVDFCQARWPKLFEPD